MRGLSAIVLMGILAPGMKAAEPGTPARIKHSYSNIPLSFEANRGQADSRVKYLARSANYSVLLTPDQTIVESKRGVIRMTLVGAKPSVGVQGVDLQAAKSNYFIGNDPAKWLTGVPHYGRVAYSGVYSGVDLAYYGNGRQLEYDWIVNPGANPRSIRMRYEGVRRLRIDKNGDLLLEMADGFLRHQKPLVYQDRNGKRETLDGHFVLRGKREVGFDVASYDRTLPLTIDPVLAYSSYLGGSGIDIAFDVAVDTNGNSYVTGITNSSISRYNCHSSPITQAKPALIAITALRWAQPVLSTSPVLMPS